MSAADVGQENEPSRERRATLAALVMLACAARLAVIAPVWRQPPNDPDYYLPLARGLAEGHGLVLHGRPTAFRPPLYPLLLAPLVAAWGTDDARPFLVLNLALGVGTVLLTHAAALRWCGSSTRAAVAAAIVAIDPVLIVQARSVMTESLAACLMAATLLALADARAARGCILGGTGFGLAALCRPSLLPAAALVALGVAARGPGTPLIRVRLALCLALATALVVLPWAVRNRLVLGEAVWTTTHGGYTLALANNTAYYDDVLHGPAGAVWSGPHQADWVARMQRLTTGMTEPAADRVLHGAGMAMIVERPRDFASASLGRLARFWGIAPADGVYPAWLRIACASWTVPLWIALVAGLARGETWTWPRLAAPLALLGLSAVHALYWTDLRMRAPVVPAIALLAAQARLRSAYSGPNQRDRS
jgi:4-amino-4-deoxy-L-arabinose transferase-like glycosyltransferase